MTETDAFMQAIIENPDDDTPRLIYADYLEEHGEPERAESVRVQIELAKYGDHRCPNYDKQNGTLAGLPVVMVGGGDCGCRWCVLKRRQKYLLESAASAWKWLPAVMADKGWTLTYNRGFIAEITLACADWLQHREALLKAAPLEKVTLTQAELVGYQDELYAFPSSWGFATLSCIVENGKLRDRNKDVIAVTAKEIEAIFGIRSFS